MPLILDQIRRDAMNLPEKERAGLAHDLLTSLEPEDPDAEQTWAEEVNKRLARIRSGEEKGKPAEEVFKEIRNDLAKGKIDSGAEQDLKESVPLV
jgi:putative addiction module component (TIGR02574 family)